MKSGVCGLGLLAAIEPARISALLQKWAHVKSKVAASHMGWVNSHWDDLGVAKSLSEVEECVSKALIAVTIDTVEGTRWIKTIIEMESKDPLKHVSTGVEMELQATIIRIRSELERDGSEELMNVAACIVKLHNCAAVVCRSLPGSASLVVNSDAEIVVAELEQASSLVLVEVSKMVLR